MTIKLTIKKERYMTIKLIGARISNWLRSPFSGLHFPLKETLVMYGEHPEDAAAIEAMLDARRASVTTKKRVAQFKAKGYADRLELTAICEDAAGIIPEPGNVVKRLAEYNAVLAWEEFRAMLDLPPNTR